MQWNRSRGKCTGIRVEARAGRRALYAAATCHRWCRRRATTESDHSEDEVRSKAERGGAEIRAIGDTRHRAYMTADALYLTSMILLNCLALSTNCSGGKALNSIRSAPPAISVTCLSASFPSACIRRYGTAEIVMFLSPLRPALVFLHLYTRWPTHILA